MCLSCTVVSTARIIISSKCRFQATVLCDIIVMYLLKRGAFYKEKKYQIITDDDAFQGFGYGSMENSPEQVCCAFSVSASETL